MRFNQPVIEVDEWKADPNQIKGWMSCLVEGCDGCVIPYFPNWKASHDVNCALCGQRYYVKDLIPLLEFMGMTLLTELRINLADVNNCLPD